MVFKSLNPSKCYKLFRASSKILAWHCKFVLKVMLVPACVYVYICMCYIPFHVYCRVAFRTTPMDSTGIPHILEHTALCGSEKFPVRDPFFKMLNRSLSTFMNAFTGKYSIRHFNQTTLRAAKTGLTIFEYI